MAPTGLITSWQTLEQSSAARSRGSRANTVICHPSAKLNISRPRRPGVAFLSCMACPKLLPHENPHAGGGAINRKLVFDEPLPVEAESGPQFANDKLTNPHALTCNFRTWDFNQTSLNGAPAQKQMAIFVKNQGIDRDAIAEIFAEIALEAAVAVMAVYAADSNARRKADGSPVCDADEAAEAIILQRLAARLPDFPVLAEEAASRGQSTVSQAAFIL